ncbi:hypothetical protein [Ideonella sp. A 288]|uniref:hypothetical protein n=1 Tax=Ideonella sp. A 288 TaxID=1962181 RepID=UPI0011870939|nr:hypothetical protein [Ideonella sp. A 288]
MLTLAAPWWLLGLGLLPVIRWLHRGGAHRRVVQVARLGLWRGSAVSPPAAGTRRPPDPAWRRRALLATLCLLALAEPQWPLQATRITLWVDDSLSMRTREGPATRLAEGLASARTALDEVAGAEVEVRALGDPWHNLGALSPSTVATVSAAAAGRQEPGAPPAPLLRSDRLHWLLTDGADAALLDWPGGRRPDRVVQVGRVASNIGLARLSARRHPDDADRIDLLLTVANGGASAETREIVVSTDAGEALRSTRQIEPGRSVQVAATVPASARVRATLQPGDALAEDDEIALDLAPLRRRKVAVDPACPPALAAAVAAHPALTVAAAGAADADAALHCGTADAARRVPTIHARADRAPARATGAVQWSTAVADARRVRLDTDRLALAARLQPRPADTVLLAIGGEPVIVGRAGAPTQVDTSLDFATMALAPGADTPLLVNLMAEQVLDARLLDEIAVTDRGAAASRVAPAASAAAVVTPPGDPKGAAVSDAHRARALADGVRPLLGLALLVLLWEIAALGRQWRRLRPVAEAPRP